MKYLLATALILISTSVQAQKTSEKIFVTPVAGTVVLRDVEDKYNAQVISLEAPEPDGGDEQEDFRALKAQVERRFPYRRGVAGSIGAKTSAGVLPPVIENAFVPDSITGIPPD